MAAPAGRVTITPEWWVSILLMNKHHSIIMTMIGLVCDTRIDHHILSGTLGRSTQRGAHCHTPLFKATLTGFRKARLRKVQICPRLAETKRKNIFLDHMNGKLCLGSSRYWLHKFDQNITKTAYFVIFWHSLLAAGTNIT